LSCFPIQTLSTQHHFQLKTENFIYVFWPFINKTFCGLENANFWKRYSKCKFLKMTPLSSLCKLQEKCKFLKMLTSCTCVLCVSLQSDIANYWPDMHNTVFLIVFADPCERGIILITLSSVREKHKGKTFPFLVHRCHVNVPWMHC